MKTLRERPLRFWTWTVIAVALAAVALSTVAVGVHQRTAQAVPVITFDGSPGTGAPPATLGPYAMTAFGNDARPLLSNVTDVPDPAGTILFSIPLSHRKIGQGWATWSHGYTGDVYYTNGATSVTLTMPASTVAFYFYAEPNPFSSFTFVATAQDGTTSGPVSVQGASGARYFGFYGTGGAAIATIAVSAAVDFAVGEFGIATAPPPPQEADVKKIDMQVTGSESVNEDGTFAGAANGNCANGIDDDGDTGIDLADPECNDIPVSEQAFFQLLEVLHNNGPNPLVNVLDIKKIDALSADEFVRVCDPSIHIDGVFADNFDNDANQLAAALRACPGGGGWTPPPAQDLPDTNGSGQTILDDQANRSPATKANIIAAINNHKAGKQPGDEFVFYFSGHATCGAGAIDTVGPNMTGAELRDALSGFQKSVTITVILDTCFSGGFIPDLSGITDAGANGVAGDADDEVLDRHHLKILASSRATEASFGLATGSEFTLNLVECLNPAGAPIADTNGDGVVTSHELMNCAKPKTVNADQNIAPKGAQNPVQFPAEGDTQVSFVFSPDIVEVEIVGGVQYYFKDDVDADGKCDPPKLPWFNGSDFGLPDREHGQLPVGQLPPPPLPGIDPGDCIVADGFPSVEFELGIKKLIQLPVSVPVLDLTQFDIHCLGPSEHTFRLSDEIVILDEFVDDPNLLNNTGSTSITVECIAESDVKIVDFNCTAPPQIAVSQDVEIQCTNVLHNNGPSGPTVVEVKKTVTAPPDCTVTPQTETEQVLLPVSVPVQLVETFTIHCSEPSFQTFKIENDISIKDLHVEDPLPGNNSVSANFTVAAIAQADVKIVDFTCDAPPDIPVSVAVPIDCTKVLHNNGPYGPVEVQVVKWATAPPDCTIDPATETEQVLLPVSVPVVLVETFTIHCFNPSFHTFSVDNDISIKDLHVEDPLPGNNSVSANFTVAAIAQADVKVTDVSVTCDDPVDVNTAFSCTVENTVHNNGPFGPVNADVTESLSGPPDCTLTPVGSQTQQDVSLAVSVPLVVSRTWSVTCSDRSFHTFSGSSDVQVDQLHIVDPDPTNNSGSGQDTIAVFDLADLKVTGVTVTCDDPVDTNTPFDCTVDVDVHNNGPTTPVNADVTVGLSVPADCTDPADQTQQDLSLAASVAQTVSKTFTTECSLRSSHTFSGSGDVQVDQLHVRDPDPSNNSGSGQGANSVFDRADAKVTGVTIDCPASGNVGVPFTCSVEVTIHNNGPTSPVDVGGAINVGVPDDCTVENYNLFGQGYGLVSLAASVSQTVTKDFNITCSQVSFHHIVGCGIVQVNQLHVQDQVPIANNFGTAEAIVDIGVDHTGDRDPGRCATLDPVEICGNGIDDDGDTLIDEEPDTDRDGINNCDDLDDDGDGFSDIVEAYVGTAPLAACPWVVGVHAAWPPDFDDSQDVNIIDVLALKPAFGSTAADANYVPRNDLNADGNINIIDVLTLKPVFGSSCN